MATGLAAPPQSSKQAPHPTATSSATVAAAALSLSGHAERVASTGTVAGHDVHRPVSDPAAGVGTAAAPTTGVNRTARSPEPPRGQRTSSPVVTSPVGAEADSTGGREAKRRRIADRSEGPDAVGPGSESPWLGGGKVTEAARGSQGGSQDSATQAGNHERACAVERGGSPAVEECGDGEPSPLEPSLDWKWTESEPGDEDVVASGPGPGAAAPGCGQHLHRAASNGSCDGGRVGGSGDGSGVGPCQIPDVIAGAASRPGGMQGSASPLPPPPPAAAAAAAVGAPPAAGGLSFQSLPRAWAQAMGAAAAAAAQRALVPSRLARRRLGLSDAPAPQQPSTLQPPPPPQQPSTQQPSTQQQITQEHSTQQPSAQQDEGEALTPQQQQVQDLPQQEQQAEMHAPQPPHEDDDSVGDPYTSASEHTQTQDADQEAPVSGEMRAPPTGQPRVPALASGWLPRNELFVRRRLTGIVLAGRAPAVCPADGTADASAATPAARAAAGVRRPGTAPGARPATAGRTGVGPLRRPAVQPAKQVARRGKGAGKEAAERPSMSALDLSKAPSYMLPLGREGIRKGVAAVLGALQVGGMGPGAAGGACGALCTIRQVVGCSTKMCRGGYCAVQLGAVAMWPLEAFCHTVCSSGREEVRQHERSGMPAQAVE